MTARVCGRNQNDVNTHMDCTCFQLFMTNFLSYPETDPDKTNYHALTCSSAVPCVMHVEHPENQTSDKKVKWYIGFIIKSDEQEQIRSEHVTYKSQYQMS